MLNPCLGRSGAVSQGTSCLWARPLQAIRAKNRMRCYRACSAAKRVYPMFQGMAMPNAPSLSQSSSHLHQLALSQSVELSPAGNMSLFSRNRPRDSRHIMIFKGPLTAGAFASLFGAYTWLFLDARGDDTSGYPHGRTEMAGGCPYNQRRRRPTPSRVFRSFPLPLFISFLYLFHDFHAQSDMARFSIISALVSLSISCVLAAPQGPGGGGNGGFVPLIDKKYTWDNIVR